MSNMMTGSTKCCFSRRVSIHKRLRLLNSQLSPTATTTTRSIRIMEPKEGRRRKPRILCLHGFRTSGSILKTLVLKRWPDTLINRLDLHFLDGPFPATGKSDAEGFFDPPYFEWYNSSEDFSEYKGFDESLEYIGEYMLNNGPFDGLLGFSQGAFISAAVPGMQDQGVALTKVPKIKFLILIAGGKFVGLKMTGQPKLAANAFSSPVQCPSLHIIGDADNLKDASNELIESFVNPEVIRHPRGHTIPKFDDAGLKVMLAFIDKIQEMLPQQEDQ